jgi:PEGA domain
MMHPRGCVIPKARAFTSGPRDLARSETAPGTVIHRAGVSQGSFVTDRERTARYKSDKLRAGSLTRLNCAAFRDDAHETACLFSPESSNNTVGKHPARIRIGFSRKFAMRSGRLSFSRTFWMLFAIAVFLFPMVARSDNQVMGEIQFKGKSKIEKSSGVWVDGQYVGYLKELKGDKKVLLLPGEHTISVRQNGYQDFTERVLVHPGEKQVVRVVMSEAPTGAMPTLWSEVKIEVNPSRAAVFLDGRFVGHVAEFEGVWHSLLIAPGDHKIKIALPGFQTFETEINPAPKQKVEVKTNLLKARGPIEDPSLQGGEGNQTPPHL